MRSVPPSHLGCLREGISLLRRHPALTLGLALLSMLLGQLGPALELAAKASSNQLAQVFFGFMGILPMQMYFLPRFQARLDAEVLNSPQNRLEVWTSTFDTRWLLAFGIWLLFVLGMLLILPGIVLLAFFGWAPLRVLLRGDSLMDAFRWSQAAMMRNWPRVVQVVLAMVMVFLAYLMVSTYALAHVLPSLNPDLGPDAWLRLRHPAFWILGFTSGLLNLWLTTSLLALYHRLEAMAQASSASSSR